ncbi:histidinol-phosphate transaminase [Coriobacteriia bacterium Es71-Z0120]|uniref:histidinol-phosphate transaminase n=1 Tax=Parvivirga hydrogeniphila TaxID=2939460 RepID=UPI00226087FB|nr:histidinol-phosphate transaminase [Parvivirga hydrogeniphila]MCL4079051.1 histidinol-phosphate transaminase [Parvivirga hydrogeniphila]
MAIDDIIRPDLEPLVPYAPGLRASQVREQAGVDTVLKLSSNEHPCGPFPTAMAAMRAVLPRLNRYPDGACAALKEKLARRLGVDTETLVIGNGSNEVLRLIAQAVLRPGDEVVFAWPSFVVYPMVAAIFGGVAVRVPLADGDVHDLEAILDAITPRTRIVFLCNPNNPTGTIYGKDAFARFMERVPDHVLVVVDEAYFEFVTSPEFPDALTWFDGERPLAVCRTFSKMYSLAGLRVGYAVMPPVLARAIDKVREPFNVNTVAQVAAYYSLDDEAEVRRRRAENQEQKTYLYSCFDRLGITYAPSETNFVYVHTSQPVEAFQALLAEGVIVRDFGTSPALRVTVGTPSDTERTIRAFEAAAAKLGHI